MSGTVKKILAGLVLFGSGLVVGIFGSRLLSERATLAIFHGDSHRFADMVLRHLSTDLDLTEAQREKVRPILYQTATKMAEIRREQEPKIKEVLDQDIASVKAILTPEQREKFEAILKHLRERRRALDHFGPPPPPPDLGPPPDGPPPGLEPPPPPFGPGQPPGPPPHDGPHHGPHQGPPHPDHPEGREPADDTQI